jgi:hypothetical protein
MVDFKMTACPLVCMNEILSRWDSESMETQKPSTNYVVWVRAKVQASLDDPRPSIPHDQVMAEMNAIIAEADRRDSTLE